MPRKNLATWRINGPWVDDRQSINSIRVIRVLLRWRIWKQAFERWGRKDVRLRSKAFIRQRWNEEKKILYRNFSYSMLDFVTMIIYVNDDTRSSVGNEIYVPCSSPISTIRIFDIVVSILVPPPFLYYDLFHETHAEAYSRLFHDHLKYISSSSSFEKKFGKLIN